MSNPAPEPLPARDCPLCPRLAAYREAQQRLHPHWFNGPVPSFGDKQAELLIVGLAPGLKGANRTGRPFTGDHAGGLLYDTLGKFGFAHGIYDARPDDGLELRRVRITNTVRCVPPQNKPAPGEIATCRTFLAEVDAPASTAQFVQGSACKADGKWMIHDLRPWKQT